MHTQTDNESVDDDRRDQEWNDLKSGAGVPDFLSYDLHLECVLQELTVYVKSLESETLDQNLQLRVHTYDFETLINQLAVDQPELDTSSRPRYPVDLESNISRVITFAALI